MLKISLKHYSINITQYISSTRPFFICLTLNLQKFFIFPHFSTLSLFVMTQLKKFQSSLKKKEKKKLSLTDILLVFQKISLTAPQNSDQDLHHATNIHTLRRDVLSLSFQVPRDRAKISGFLFLLFYVEYVYRNRISHLTFICL